MTIDGLLGLLKGVRQTGRSQYVAICPAHEDRSPSLSVRACPDGRLLIHCFAGCSTQSVLDSVGLRLADLYPDQLSEHYRPERRPFDALQALHCVAQEIAVVSVIAEDIVSGTPVTKELRDRLVVAAGRLSSALHLVGAA